MKFNFLIKQMQTQLGKFILKKSLNHTPEKGGLYDMQNMPQ